MKDFHFYAPTEVVFGVDAENSLVELVKKYGGNKPKVLIHYGGGSAIRSGLIGRTELSDGKQMSGITVTYRRTSRLSIRIGKRGDIRVSAPYGLPKEEVEKFIIEHQDWIKKAQQRTAERVNKRNEFFNQLPLSTKQECKDATDRLDAIILPLVKKYSAMMGVLPSGIEYRATISRWGCCDSKTKRIQFSAYLLLLPDWCIEHVVVHELAHLIVPNHSHKFYAIMDKFFPRWREAREETKRISR